MTRTRMTVAVVGLVAGFALQRVRVMLVARLVWVVLLVGAELALKVLLALLLIFLSMGAGGISLIAVGFIYQRIQVCSTV